MQKLKYVLSYLVWIILSLLLGIVYMRLVLGPNDVPEDGLWYVLHVFYQIGLIHIGLRVGAVIAVCFILLDMIYLRKKLQHNPKKTIIRIGLLLVISVLVAMVHHVLEKVIDVI